MLSLGERGYQIVSLNRVSYGVKANHDMLGEECHQAISVVDNITSLVFGFKSHSFIWMIIAIDGNVVKLGHKFVNDINMTSVGQSRIKIPISMIKDNGTFALESFSFIFEMGQIDYMSVV